MQFQSCFTFMFYLKNVLVYINWILFGEGGNGIAYSNLTRFNLNFIKHLKFSNVIITITIIIFIITKKDGLILYLIFTVAAKPIFSSTFGLNFFTAFSMNLYALYQNFYSYYSKGYLKLKSFKTRRNESTNRCIIKKMFTLFKYVRFPHYNFI